MLERKYPTLADLRRLDGSVQVNLRPLRRPVMLGTASFPRWELRLGGERIRGPVDGQFFDTRKDAELHALRIIPAGTLNPLFAQPVEGEVR